MSHNHSHSCSCDHSEVKFCKHCNTVYCTSCNQEWTAKSNWNWNGWYGYTSKPWTTLLGQSNASDYLSLTRTSEPTLTASSGSHSQSLPDLDPTVNTSLTQTKCDHKG